MCHYNSTNNKGKPLMTTQQILGALTGLALVNPFSAALQAMATTYPGDAGFRQGVCNMRAGDGELLQQFKCMAIPGSIINLEDGFRMDAHNGELVQSGQRGQCLTHQPSRISFCPLF